VCLNWQEMIIEDINGKLDVVLAGQAGLEGILHKHFAENRQNHRNFQALIKALDDTANGKSVMFPL